MKAYVQTTTGPVALDGESTTLGRAERNDVCLCHDSVSRLHAVLEFRSGTWCVRDVSSRNGTWVNGERLFAERVLRDGDEIRLGAVRLVFRHAPDVPDLTRPERDVLVALFRNGAEHPRTEPASTREIAMALVLTEAAVKVHLRSLYRAFDVPANAPQRRARLLDEAIRRGALRVPAEATR